MNTHQQSQLNLLLLGGTYEAKQLAKQLQALKTIHITYSLAGLTQAPDLNCQLISGGFTQYGGMTHYLHQHKINLLIDASHPYAEKISEAAYQATQALNIPYWRYTRSAWQAEPVDHWQYICLSQLEAIIQQTTNYQRIFLSIGQSATQLLERLLPRYPNRLFLLRTATDLAPQLSHYTNLHHKQAIGGFTKQHEYQLLRDYRIDCLVSKNSGGTHSFAKLLAARELNIPVLMLKRPSLPPASQEFFQLDDLLDAIKHFA